MISSTKSGADVLAFPTRAGTPRAARRPRPARGPYETTVFSHHDRWGVFLRPGDFDALVGRPNTGLRLHDLVHPDDRRDFETWWAEAVTAGHGERSYRLVARHGDEVLVKTTVRLTAAPVGGLEMVARTLLVTDPDARLHQAEARSRELSKRLAAAEDAHRERLAFASGAIHDLRSRLGRMAMLGQALVELTGCDLDEEGQSLVAGMLGSVGEVARFLDEALFQVRASAVAPRLTCVDTRHLVAQAFTVLESEIEDRAATVMVGEEMPVVEADPALLRRAFQNLVANAIKAGPAGRPVRVEVSSRRLAGGWELLVTDDGMGIAPEDRERIYRPFERGRQQPGQEGSGLGLSICKTVMEAHRGHIRSEAAAGGGTTFVLFLPDPVAQASHDDGCCPDSRSRSC